MRGLCAKPFLISPLLASCVPLDKNSMSGLLVWLAAERWTVVISHNGVVLRLGWQRKLLVGRNSASVGEGRVSQMLFAQGAFVPVCTMSYRRSFLAMCRLKQQNQGSALRYWINYIHRAYILWCLRVQNVKSNSSLLQIQLGITVSGCLRKYHLVIYLLNTNSVFFLRVACIFHSVCVLNQILFLLSWYFAFFYKQGEAEPLSI